MNHPYENIPSYCNWYQAMTAFAPGQINPVTSSFKITSDTKIATMGSCFAQHLARFIKLNGFNYLITEKKSDEILDVDNKFNYGTFSARFGNIYTTKQALQLIQRAYNEFNPSDDIWVKDDYYVDAFRPNIQPLGFSTKDALLTDRLKHLNCVKEMIEQADVLIFTLGLTETWESQLDGAVYPVAPGVSGGVFNSEKYLFRNFSVNEFITDLSQFVSSIRAINENIKIILTVSPVPLIATKENRHVLVSTTVSKSILRVAADEIEKKFDYVIYFPSFEIITSSANCGAYYAEDLREVTERGIAHVMRVFKESFLNDDITNEIILNEPSKDYSRTLSEIVCDEELIQQAITASSFCP